MHRFSAFLQARQRAIVPVMFSRLAWPACFAIGSATYPEAHAEGHTGSPKYRAISLIQRDKSGIVDGRIDGVRRQLRRAAPWFLPLALAACGLNGTDRYDEPASDATEDTTGAPETAEETFEEVAIPDSDSRPTMQVQVVLDRLGFGPGVIDGREGLSTANALKGFQEANGLDATGELDPATRGALARWETVAATRVVRIPESWGQERYRTVPDEPADQATRDRLGYESIAERLAERFHTTVEVLGQLNPGGNPARAQDEPVSTPTSPATDEGDPPPVFRAGQLVRVPNAGVETGPADAELGQEWRRTLASLGVAADQPSASAIVVDKSGGWLKAYGEGGKLIAMFTVTTGSRHDPLPLGEWGINGVARNPPFAYDPELFWDVPDDEQKQQIPPGPNGPVGVVWIDLTREHYGIHGTPDPESIGRAQSHGCVRLTNWDAARLAGMIDGSTKVTFQA